MLQCNKCGKILDEGQEKIYSAFDLQKKEEKDFCSAEHLKEWMIAKIIWMVLSLILGFIIMILSLSEIGGTAVTMLFLPYMIRQVRHSLADIFDGGTAGEIISFAIVLLGTITVIYPAFKLYQEISLYINLKNKYLL